MEVGNNDLGPIHWFQQVIGNNVHRTVIAFRVGWQQHAKSVADGNAGGDDQKGVGEAGVLGVGDLIEGVPSDRHGHHHRFPRTGGKFAGSAMEAGIGFLARLCEVVVNPLIAIFFGYFGDVYECFKGLNLAEK